MGIRYSNPRITMELKGSKTEANLLTAFAGECQARTKYTYYASQAKKEGYEQIADIFMETAENEKEHAKLWFKALHDGAVPDTVANLKDAAEGACITVSGVCALMAGHFTFRGEKYKIAVITCTVATIAAFIGIITLLVGIFVTYRLTQYKSAFKS